MKLEDRRSQLVSVFSLSRIDSRMIIPVCSNGRLPFWKYTYCPPPKKKEINLSCVGWCAPSFQRLRQQNHLEVPVQPLLYRGFLPQKKGNLELGRCLIQSNTLHAGMRACVLSPAPTEKVTHSGVCLRSQHRGAGDKRMPGAC